MNVIVVGGIQGNHDPAVKGVKYRPLQEKESRSSMWLALRGDRSSPQEEMFATLATSLRLSMPA
ncbi:MAG TPA: hypothetical protein VK673_06970 [Chthoniobacterales bacterium]|nr:hypothetical protein [Chthoniobacterales bacterium]